MPYICLADETNRSHADHEKFFINGAVIAPVEKLELVHDTVTRIRERNGFQPRMHLKWATSSRPTRISQEQFFKAKAEVLRAFPDLGLLFFSNLTLHRIAKYQPPATLVRWGYNTIIKSFEVFLSEKDDTGILMIDRLPTGGENDYLNEVFARRTGPEGNFSLKRTHLLGITCSGASHLSTVLDIVLGAFAFSVNERRPDRWEKPARLLRDVLQGTWCYVDEAGARHIHPEAMVFSPRRRMLPYMDQEYTQLKAHLDHLIRNLEQME